MQANSSTALTTGGTLRIAMQKSGRLSEGSIALLREMGLEFETYKDRLFVSARNMDVDILFLRDDDIPEYVQDGVAHLGIVGSNILEERRPAVDRLLDLDFGYCKLNIAVPEDSLIDDLEDLTGKRIATSYPEALRRFLNEKKIEATPVLLRGSVEVTPALGVADAICDLVSTGSTLRTHGLRSIQTVFDSRAVLICQSNMKPEKSAFVQKLLMRAKGVQDGRRCKYIMFNAPKTNLDLIKERIPACRSPTIMNLADQKFVAVHTVITPEDAFWDVIEEIRACGGTDILVASIEKFIR